MFSLLLIIIYLGFIALGLPDSLFGSSWPVIHVLMDVPISYAGIVTITISGCTIISSLLAERLVKKFKSSIVCCISILLTALALIGFSLSTRFFMLIIFSIPLGLGAGAIDATLNNYVALNYKAKHMNWLHCFWGIGASISPYIIGHFLEDGLNWKKGYLVVAVILLVITFILALSIPLWKKTNSNEDSENHQIYKIKDIIKIPGLKLVLIAFFAYCAMECTTFNWTSSYLVGFKELTVESAARFASLYYLGMTIGRLISGFISDRLGDIKMIRIGYYILIVGVILLMIPTKINLLTYIGLLILGIGSGPIYPSIIHMTPSTFDKEKSQAIVGLEMACAYCGSTFMPPLFGLIANHLDIKYFPLYLFIFAILGFSLIEIFLHRKKKSS